MTKITFGNNFDFDNYDEVLKDHYINLLIIKVRVCTLKSEDGAIYRTVDIYK